MAAEFRSEAGTTKVPLQFSPMRIMGHYFPGSLRRRPHRLLQARTGVNTVRSWNSPENGTSRSIQNGEGLVRLFFPELTSWTKHSEPGIKFYSGTALYRKQFDLPRTFQEGARVWLDLGNLRELGEVRINGKPMGIVWAPPFRVEITGAVKASNNQLEVDVVNFWPNRLIGDEGLPSEKRLTRTNIRKLTQSTPAHGIRPVWAGSTPYRKVNI